MTLEIGAFHDIIGLSWRRWRYADAVSKCLKLIEKGDEQKFIELFLETRKYFGDYAQKFMEESRRLLAVSSDSGRRGEEGGAK